MTDGVGGRRTGVTGSDRASTKAEADAVLTASRALLGVVARSLAPVLEEISLHQFRVLVVLSAAGQPMRSGALAAALGVHPSTFSRMADRMEAGGWVSREENPESRREVLIALKPQGRRLVENVTRRRVEEIGRILAEAAPEAREEIMAGMLAFAEASGEPAAEDLAALGM
jgi:DNA-binding MarR family transcriptional regulator